MPSWGARMFILSIATSSAATRPAARSRCCRSEASSAPVSACVTRPSASRFCRSRSRPRLSSSAFSSSRRCCTSAGTSALSWARARSARAWAELLLQVEQLHAQLDLLLLDLLLRLLELGPLLGELALDISVSSRSTLSPFFTCWPSVARNAILKLHLGHGRHADLRRAHRGQLALDVDAQHQVGALHLDRGARRRAPSDAAPAAIARPTRRRRRSSSASGRRAGAGRAQNSETRSPSARPDSTTHSSGVQAASSSFVVSPPRRFATGPSFSKRTAPRGTLRAFFHVARHHLDPHRQPGPHQRVAAGERDAHREAGSAADENQPRPPLSRDTEPTSSTRPSKTRSG